VNLLEKQLSNVYFKDVRFPWDILYQKFSIPNGMLSAGAGTDNFVSPAMYPKGSLLDYLWFVMKRSILYEGVKN